MPGAGKSTVGKKLAEVLDYNFVDTDQIIEKEYNKDLGEIIKEIGESNFLDLEEEKILYLGDIDNTVISPGGSIIHSGNALNYLRITSKIFFLDVPFEEIERRNKNNTEKIIWSLLYSLKYLYETRVPLYQDYSDITLSCLSTMTVDDVVDMILKNIREETNGKV